MGSTWIYPKSWPIGWGKWPSEPLNLELFQFSHGFTFNVQLQNLPQPLSADDFCALHGLVRTVIFKVPSWQIRKKMKTKCEHQLSCKGSFQLKCMMASCRKKIVFRQFSSSHAYSVLTRILYKYSTNSAKRKCFRTGSCKRANARRNFKGIRIGKAHKSWTVKTLLSVQKKIRHWAGSYSEPNVR